MLNANGTVVAKIEHTERSKAGLFVEREKGRAQRQREDSTQPAPGQGWNAQAGRNREFVWRDSWLPLPLGEGWGEGLSANRNHNVAAGFSPHLVMISSQASSVLKQ